MRTSPTSRLSRGGALRQTKAARPARGARAFGGNRPALVRHFAIDHGIGCQRNGVRDLSRQSSRRWRGAISRDGWRFPLRAGHAVHADPALAEPGWSVALPGRSLVWCPPVPPRVPERRAGRVFPCFSSGMTRPRQRVRGCGHSFHAKPRRREEGVRAETRRRGAGRGFHTKTRRSRRRGLVCGEAAVNSAQAGGQ